MSSPGAGKSGKPWARVPPPPADPASAEAEERGKGVAVLARGRCDPAGDAQVQRAVAPGRDPLHRGRGAGDEDVVVGAMLLPLLEEDLEGGADGLAAFHLRARRQLEDRVVRVEGEQPLEVAAAEGGEVLRV